MKIFATILLLVSLAACASAPKDTIRSDLIQIGVPANKASCISTQLKDRLNGRDLNALAKHLRSLVRADSPSDGIDAVVEIENPGVVAAVTASAISCAFASS